MSIKTALCVATAAFLASVEAGAAKIVIQTIDEQRNAYDSHVYIHSAPLNLPTTLEDRATCESDPSLLQLLPYITMIDENTGKVFGYYRGKAGGESKLVGKMSMGVGGHVEEALEPNGDLVTLLVTHAVREVFEEVGYKDLDSIRRQLEKQLIAGFTAVYQPEDPVGKFHLGLFLTVKVNPQLFGELEGGVIERGHWFDFPKAELTDPADFWEGWTQTLLGLATLGDVDASPVATNAASTEQPLVASGNGAGGQPVDASTGTGSGGVALTEEQQQNGTSVTNVPGVGETSLGSDDIGTGAVSDGERSNRITNQLLGATAVSGDVPQLDLSRGGQHGDEAGGEQQQEPQA